MRWRQGGKVPFNVYEQLASIVRDDAYPHGDRPLTMFRNEDDARLACDSVNLVQQLAAMWRSVNMGPLFGIQEFRTMWPGIAAMLDEIQTMQYSITCPACGYVSFNVNDIANSYCPKCGNDHDQIPRRNGS